MNPRSIRVRLIGWCVGLALLAFVGFTTFTYYEVRLCLINNLKTLLTQRAERIGKFLLKNVDETGEGYVANEIEGRYSPAVDLRFIRIFRPDGSLLYISANPPGSEFDVKAIPIPQGKVLSSSMQQLDFLNGFHMLLVTLPYTVGSQSYVIQAGETSMRNEQVLWSLTKSLLLFLPVFGVIIVGGIYLLIGKTLAPVDQVTTTAKEITLHNLSLRLPEARSGDELERLTRAFNEMIGRLDEAFQHASRFSMDASHELRTPLAIIQGELEVIIQDEACPERQEKMYSLLEEVRHLNKIVGNLFAISRLEAGEATLEVKQLDFNQLVHRVEEQMLALAEEKEITIGWKSDVSAVMDGDITRLKQVVVNLLDNAIKYSPQRGRIDLSLEIQGENVIFTVTNARTKITDEEFPYIFDRFYRSQSHRFDRDKGAGLGLSIVRSICTAHGGIVTATNKSDGSCSFTVQLPCITKTRKNSHVT